MTLLLVVFRLLFVGVLFCCRLEFLLIVLFFIGSFAFVSFVCWLVA